MLELKKKALGGIKKMLDDRMADKMKPKAVAVEITSMNGRQPGEAPPEAPLEEDLEGVNPESDDLEQKVSAKGGDLSKLSPEEQQQLEQLYEKMGC